MAVRQYPTLQALQKEFEDFLEEIFSGVSELFDYEENDLGVLAQAPNKLRELVESHSLGTLEEMYQFAIYGTGSLAAIPTMALLLKVERFLEGFGSSLAQTRWDNLTMINDLGAARIALDGDTSDTASGRLDGLHSDYLTVKEVALLAFVEERSVRNAISRGELQSEKDGSATMIANEEARAWLRGRRGFNPTQYIYADVSELSDITKSSELASYLQLKREKTLKLEVDQLLSQVADTHISLDDLHALESGEYRLAIEDSNELARLYREPPALMMKKIVMVFFPSLYRAIHD
jgi:hypothetical protein